MITNHSISMIILQIGTNVPKKIIKIQCCGPVVVLSWEWGDRLDGKQEVLEIYFCNSLHQKKQKKQIFGERIFLTYVAIRQNKVERQAPVTTTSDMGTSDWG